MEKRPLNRKIGYHTLRCPRCSYTHRYRDRGAICPKCFIPSPRMEEIFQQKNEKTGIWEECFGDLPKKRQEKLKEQINKINAICRLPLEK